MSEKKSVAEIVEMIESLSVLELSELVKQLEEKFGVSAQMPVVAAAGGAQAPRQHKPRKKRPSLMWFW